MTPEILQRIEELEAKIKALEAGSTIPSNVEQALRDRLQLATNPTSSAKSSTSETIPVNTAAGTLVQLAPDAFLQTTVNGTTYYIAVYT